MTLFQHSKIFKHNIDMCICTYHIEITFVCDSNHLRIRKCLFVGLMILYGSFLQFKVPTFIFNVLSDERYKNSV